MVQAHKKNKIRPLKANLTLICTFAIVLVMVVLVGVFFRFGQPPEDAPKVLSVETKQKVDRLFHKSNLLKAKGDRKQAVVVLQRLIDLLEKEKPDDWLQLASAYTAQSDTYRELGQWDKAAVFLKQAKEIVDVHHLEEQRLTCEILMREGILKFVNKDFIDAEEFFQQALGCSETLNGHLSAESSGMLIWLAEANLSPAINNPQKSMQYLLAVEEVCSSVRPERPQQMMSCQKIEGKALLSMRKFAEAEEKLLAAKEIIGKLTSDPNNGELLHITNLLKQAREGKAQTQ